jgi:hypothetical protein
LLYIIIIIIKLNRKTLTLKSQRIVCPSSVKCDFVIFLVELQTPPYYTDPHALHNKTTTVKVESGQTTIVQHIAQFSAMSDPIEAPTSTEEGGTTEVSRWY